jgi:hypothetical protein
MHVCDFCLGSLHPSAPLANSPRHKIGPCNFVRAVTLRILFSGGKAIRDSPREEIHLAQIQRVIVTSCRALPPT